MAGAEFQIIPEGDKELIKFFRDFPHLVQSEAKDFTQRALNLLVNRAADYPPPLPNQSYVRTGTLGRRWTSATPHFKVTSSVVEGRVGNITPYGPRVQSEAEQAQIFKGRWKTVEQIIDDSRPDIEKLLNQSGRNLEAIYRKRTR